MSRWRTAQWIWLLTAAGLMLQLLHSGCDILNDDDDEDVSQTPTATSGPTVTATPMAKPTATPSPHSEIGEWVGLTYIDPMHRCSYLNDTCQGEIRLAISPTGAVDGGLTMAIFWDNYMCRGCSCPAPWTGLRAKHFQAPFEDGAFYAEDRATNGSGDYLIVGGSLNPNGSICGWWEYRRYVPSVPDCYTESGVGNWCAWKSGSKVVQRREVLRSWFDN